MTTQERDDAAAKEAVARFKARCARDKITPRGFARTKIREAAQDPDAPVPPKPPCTCGQDHAAGTPCRTLTDAARGARG